MTVGAVLGIAMTSVLVLLAGLLLTVANDLLASPLRAYGAQERALIFSAIAFAALLGILPGVLFVSLAGLMLSHRFLSPLINRGSYRLVLKWRGVLVPLGLALVGFAFPDAVRVLRFVTEGLK